MALSADERAFIFACCGYPAHPVKSAQMHGLLAYRVSRLSAAEEAVARQYLATLRTLTGPTDPQTALLRDGWRRRLCGFLGVPPGPGIGVHQELAP